MAKKEGGIHGFLAALGLLLFYLYFVVCMALFIHALVKKGAWRNSGLFYKFSVFVGALTWFMVIAAVILKATGQLEN